MQSKGIGCGEWESEKGALSERGVPFPVSVPVTGIRPCSQEASPWPFPVR